MAAPDLRDRLAELEMEHATLQSELQAFHAEYLARVGVIDVQVQELQAKLARGTPEAARAERRYRETTTAMASVPVAAPPPSDDLKTLFRDAAKRIHPDLQADAAGREHAEAFMKQLNAAYSRGDAEAIGNLVRQWETSPYAVPVATSAGPAPALAAAVEQAEQRLAEARDSDLARLLDQTLMAQMHGRDLLQELRWQAEEALAEARLRVAAIDN
ncbi:J domain-containing protein [Solirubrobacter sp. CPCC 204708]|uniref:J domain-containing protein n=1 Tax=Solirubrobacter deserti TaxID=2282478 RepID=A0ABT4RVC7_9ACTN|nr:J domain-containing protein [Solirubrobacter deserti]MBE2320668.1 J domain-containing protein [Solirubrobacter deserti]MDA0142427.1 J domain-containing protein [Solirubrobacter deserti]